MSGEVNSKPRVVEAELEDGTYEPWTGGGGISPEAESDLEDAFRDAIEEQQSSREDKEDEKNENIIDVE